MVNISFDTTQPTQVQGLNGYTVDPLFTVGDKIGNYVPPGILDGLGAFSLNDTTVRVLANHELGPTLGYKYALKNGTELPGARVSYFDIDKRTFQIIDSGLAYDTIINRAGQVVDAAADLEFAGIARLCSAALFEANQFGAGIGLADRIFFTGEENDGGTEFALDPTTKTLHALPSFGRAAWENVTEMNTGRTDRVAFLIGDDRDPAPLLLYVGEKNAKNDGSFLDRNGLGKGKLYAWVADDPALATDPIEADPRDFKGTNSFRGGKFVALDYYRPDRKNTAVDGTDEGTSIQDELGYDAFGYATQAQQDKLAADAKAFLFSRPEDLATNPNDGTQAVLASTGRESIFGGADTWGTTYKIDLNFNNINTGDISARIDILYDGNDAGNRDAGLRSPDNLTWASDGKIYLQEDRAISSTLFGATARQEASIFTLDPSAANPSSTLTRIAQVDRTALPTGQTDASPTDVGNWETSGILDVSKLFGNKPGEILLFDVQAHSLRDGSIITATNRDGDGNGTRTRQENLVEGGQLSLLISPAAKLLQASTLVAATTDTIEAGVTPGFDGVNDIVFAGSGNDTVDAALGGVLASGNRIDAGQGADKIYAANNDRVFGGTGDDLIEAGEASGYRASGGAGNDTFFLGKDGRALGGEGNDKFFAGTDGGNLLSGGAGVDQFWIASSAIPTGANTILDFQIGTDVIGIQGAASLGITASNLVVAQVGADASIGFGGQTLAIIKGIQASSLTPSNASQFVFA
jgi:serralysin